MTYQYNQKPNTSFSEKAQGIIEKIKLSEYAVLVGRNNCGKSFLLKNITLGIGESASYIGPARYQNFNVLGAYVPNENRKKDKWAQFYQQFQQTQQNIDSSPLNLQQAIGELSDEVRKELTEIVELLLGSKLEILHTVLDNSMSQKYISCDGHNISYTSSGFRLITTLITCLLNKDYDIFLIDEPELGISPEAQGVLADFLFERSHRERFFPHIKTLIFATHSTIFLDRQNMSNNYTVKKDGDIIDIAEVASQADFNRIHFFLLGNRFETLYLPTAIVLTEGKTDQELITKILEIEYPDSQFSVVNANSDSRMKEIIHTARSLFSDMQKSPYRDRIFPVLDSVHGVDIVEKLKEMGLREDNIIVWDNNGIEYCYPPKVIDTIYGIGSELIISDDNVSRNGVKYKKAELASMVCSQITKDTEYPQEFIDKFIFTLESVTGLKSRFSKS